jgi:hypothetical protein
MGGAREFSEKNVRWQISGTHLNKECLNLTSHLLKKTSHQSVKILNHSCRAEAI